MVDTLPSSEVLNECFEYDKKSGIVKWKERPSHHFTSNRTMKATNTRFKDKQVNKVCNVGYIRVGVYDQRYYLHRIIWKMVTGEDPGDLQINHKDGDKLNNAWDNLEAITHRDNVLHAFSTGLINKKGEFHHNSKLNDKKVELLRREFKNGKTTRELAKKYSLDNATVYDAVNHRTWKHLE